MNMTLLEAAKVELYRQLIRANLDQVSEEDDYSDADAELMCILAREPIIQKILDQG